MNILNQLAAKINGKLDTFDRMIINGYLLPLCNYKQFSYYLIQKGIKLVGFDKLASGQTNVLCRHIENYITDNGVALEYLNSGKIDKNELAREKLALTPDKKGIIAVFSTVELCSTTTVKPNRNSHMLEITSRSTKCRHYYFYYNDEEFGWMFLKIQTWFPYNVQIYFNGREYIVGDNFLTSLFHS